MRALLETPRMWGSDEAVEMQALQLLEFRALIQSPEEADLHPGRILDAYTTFIHHRFPYATSPPLSQIVHSDDTGLNFARHFQEFLNLGLEERLPSVLYVGLFNQSSPARSGFSEVCGGGYTRMHVTWEVPLAYELRNAEAIHFPQATSNWGDVVAVGVFDAPTEGQPLLVVRSTSIRSILTSDQASFPPGHLKLDVSCLPTRHPQAVENTHEST